jgi:luciferase family oxidoreductase group 1
MPSVLDLSVVNDGQTSAEALAATTELAQVADRLGYERFWVAEHHNMGTVACTSPTLLMAHLAAVTERIRIGSGGVMLPNHAPLVVAEQFALLEALHPGRIDAGIGRAPGSDQRTAMALRRSVELLGADTFPTDLLDLMAMLGDSRAEGTLADHFRATPTATTFPPVFLLGSSDYSARLAARLGLPFGFAHHFDMGGTLHAAELYHEQFRPSAVLDQPYLVVTANVLLADTQEDADWHAAPGRLTALGRRTGRFIRLIPPADAAAHPDLAEATRLPTSRVVGTPESGVPQLRTLVERTGADELMVTAVAYDLAARVRSLELLAEHW